MRSNVFILAAALLAAPLVASAQSGPPAKPADASAPAAAFNTATTPLGDILDNPAAKAVVQRHLPDLMANEQINMARSLTLKGLQSYAADQVTDKALAAIDADFAKLPATK